MFRSAAAALCASGVAFPAIAQGHTYQQIRYDFTIEVIENGVAGTPEATTHPELAELSVGTTGTLTALATAFDEFSTASDVGWWQMDEVVLSHGSMHLQSSAASGYPSTIPFRCFSVLNDVDNTGDLLQFVPVWNDAPFGTIGLEIIDVDTAFPDTVGDLLDSSELPTELDLSNENTTTRFDLGTRTGERRTVRHAITDVTITIIPAPATVGLLMPGALLMRRCRRGEPLPA